MKINIMIIALIFISCTKKNINSIVIQNDRSSEINLFEGEYVIHFMSKEDSKYKFPIEREEILEIKNTYERENIFDYGKELIVEEEEVFSMPLSDAKYIIHFEDGTKQIIIVRTDFVKNPLNMKKYRQLKKFIDKINDIIKSKKEIQSAPKSDVFYL
ncbi:MAG TPA: hypothetical protein VF677_01610 [Flavobacterium sp.]|jgi:hypothetical protein